MSASSRVAASSSILNATTTERLLSYERFTLCLHVMAHYLVELACDRPLGIWYQVDVAVRHRLSCVFETRRYQGHRPMDTSMEVRQSTR